MKDLDGLFDSGSRSNPDPNALTCNGGDQLRQAVLGCRFRKIQEGLNGLWILDESLFEIEDLKALGQSALIRGDPLTVLEDQGEASRQLQARIERILSLRFVRRELGP